jgi:hypothetical protein
MEKISIPYIGLGPKIQIFVEAGPARLPLIHFPEAQLEASAPDRPEAFVLTVLR